MSKNSLGHEELLAALDEHMREARGLLGDLHRAMKEARELAPKLAGSMIEEEVTNQLTKLGELTKKEMEKSVAKVGKEFDKLENLFLGRDPKSRKAGKPAIDDLIVAAKVHDHLQATYGRGES